MAISETQAWQIVETFAGDLAAELGTGLLSVIAIGSLSGGYYRPGVSDIDAVVVVTADARPVAASLVERLREEYRVRYRVPKEFGAFVVTPEQVLPPYPPEEEMAPEVQRIVDQGRVVYGAQIPVVSPTRAELLGYMRWFDRWLETECLPANAPEGLDYHAAYNVAAMACRHYIYALSNENEMVWEKAQALHTFVERHPDHPHVAIIRRLIDLGGDDPGLGLQIGPEAIELWRALHREIHEGGRP